MTAMRIQPQNKPQTKPQIKTWARTSSPSITPNEVERKTTMKRNTRRGLTLLELMIVLIILVGLIAIVGPRLLGTQKKADIRTAQAQIGNLASALKLGWALYRGG
jgi:prepilin-type N-terminal cleavage/methylation domain-containing protein